ASAAEAYLAAITAREARLASAGPVDLRVTEDPAVPAGRYQFRQGRLAGAGLAPGYSLPPAGFAGPPMMAPLPPAPLPSVPAAGYAAAAPAAYPVPAPAFAGPMSYAGHRPGDAFPFAHDGRTAQEPVKAAGGLPAPAGLPESVTISAPTATPSPLLRLVTGDSSVETRVSGAQAGRGLSAELRLPDDPTVSRVHAKFTFASGNWSITGLGLNGLMVNGVQVNGDCALHDGDVICWGSRPDSLASRVEIR
ncbi:MAG: FHA domain-containing protein, partial [Actinomycetota bacterium]